MSSKRVTHFRFLLFEIASAVNLVQPLHHPTGGLRNTTNISQSEKALHLHPKSLGNMVKISKDGNPYVLHHPTGDGAIPSAHRNFKMATRIWRRRVTPPCHVIVQYHQHMGDKLGKAIWKESKCIRGWDDRATPSIKVLDPFYFWGDILYRIIERISNSLLPFCFMYASVFLASHAITSWTMIALKSFLVMNERVSREIILPCEWSITNLTMVHIGYKLDTCFPRWMMWPVLPTLYIYPVRVHSM